MSKIEKIKMFQQEMEQRGFHKDRYGRFVKAINDARLSLFFGYTTKDSCYLNFFIDYPKSEMVIHSIGNYQIPFLGGNTGYLLPERNFKEWSLKNVDAISGIPIVMSDIVGAIDCYILPLLVRYSVIETLLADFETLKLPKVFRIEERLLPILYYVVGRESRSMELLDGILEKYIGKEDTLNVFHRGTERKNITTLERTIPSIYIDFALKMKEFIQKNHLSRGLCK